MNVALRDVARWLTLAACIPYSAGHLLSQTTFRVGPGEAYATIQDAVGAATAGDIVEVLAGSYPGFTLDKALTIRAEPTGAVVEASSAIVGPPVGGHARLCGLRLRNVQLFGSGAASFESCELLGTPGSFAPPVVANGAAATFWRCRIADGPGGIQASASNLTLVQCDVSALGTYLYLLSISALDLRNGCVVHVSDSTLAAGRGTALAGAWPGIYVISQSQLDIVDSTVRGGDYQGQSNQVGGSAIEVGVDSVARQQRCTLLAGTGTAGPGNPSSRVTNAPLLGVHIAEPTLALGGSLTAEFRDAPSSPVFVLAAFGLTPPTTAPLVTPLHWGFTPQNAAVVAVLVADGSGNAAYSLPIPADPQLRNLGIWLTGASLAQLPAQLSPPVGGVLR
ncbi:MAG: hypothetical protein IPK26_17115 [Planctomycetes bacterium]|nr:hypothetical protein [Planctomycetota bacterium]